MFVCCITLILCAISIPIFYNKASHDIEVELDKLASIFTYLQQRAHATHQTHTATLNPSSNTVSWHRGAKTAQYQLPQNLQFGFILGAYGPPADPIAPITQAITFTHQSKPCTINFFSNGKISSGSIYLTDKKQHFMGALTLGISQVSYIRRYMYRASSWVALH